MKSSDNKDSKENKDDLNTGAAWNHIDFSELEIGDQIGGGGVGIIYKGKDISKNTCE